MPRFLVFHKLKGILELLETEFTIGAWRVCLALALTVKFLTFSSSVFFFHVKSHYFIPPERVWELHVTFSTTFRFLFVFFPLLIMLSVVIFKNILCYKTLVTNIT